MKVQKGPVMKRHTASQPRDECTSPDLHTSTQALLLGRKGQEQEKVQNIH